MPNAKPMTADRSPEVRAGTTSLVQIRALRFLLPYVRTRGRILGGALAAVLGGTLVELLKPWPLKFVFDYLLKDVSFLPVWALPSTGDARTWLLAFVCGLILFIWALSSLSAYFKEYLLQRLAEELVFELRSTLFARVQRLSLSFHDSRRVGDIITRMTRDAEAVRELVGASLLQWCTALLAILGTLAVMAYMDWRLSIVGAITIAILSPVEWRLRHQVKQAEGHKRRSEVAVSSVTQETMAALRIVKAFGRENHQQEQFGRESSQSVQAGVEVARLEARYVRAVDIVTAVSTCAVVWLGVNRVFDGALTPGDLYVFVHYVRGLHGPLRDLAKQSIKMARGSVGLERILEVLETEPDVTDSPAAAAAPRLRGALEFQNVSFAYRPGRPVLENISFKIEPGEKVALVGYSGAGKSTILGLIPRLYDPTGGRILIDGRDIRDFKVDSLREQTAFVLQESVLFHATILENILYGRPDAAPEDIREAVYAAGVQQFTHKLKDGYETTVGPRGVTLSGGERQRVAIARAMIRQAPILLLDEPTTGLDVESEQLVMDALERLMHGRTTLLISHKLNLIERADRAIVIHRGRILESGTPAELRASGGIYARLCDLAATSSLIDDSSEQSVMGAVGYGS